MKQVIVVGSGGREHALAHVLGRSTEVVVTPGNPGISGSVATSPLELEGDLFVIGPEVPLVDGLADRLRNQGKRVYGPGGDGARLEGSKAWMKELVATAGVPTARHASFREPDLAVAYLRELPPPWVVKTDGLAAGKGVLVTDSLREAEDDARAKLSGSSFGEAGRTVVIEEGLTGTELSVLAVCDGERAVPLVPARDYKRVNDGDEGPNTGGMGAYSPVPSAGDGVVDEVMDRFIEPTLWALRQEGIDYRGTLYAGLMLTADGLKLLEFNVRFGDPEAQVVLPRLTSDLADLLGQAADGKISDEPEFTTDAGVCVVAATPGYPEAPRSGGVVSGLDEVSDDPDVTLFFAGVARDDRDRLITAGGRVLNVVGHGRTLDDARARAYSGIRRISFEDMHYRSDIAVEEIQESTT